MLGEQIGEFSGRTGSQRVLEIDEEPKIEATLNATGSIKNIEITTTITYWNVRNPCGNLYGEGKGTLMTKDGEFAASMAKGRGNITEKGEVKWRGSVFYTSSAIGKLYFLNNMVGISETDVDSLGNVREKIWEWK